MKIAWSGVHERRKALNILLRSLEGGIDGGFELIVLGEGRQTRKWKRLAERLGIAESVKWLGWVARDKAVAALRGADVFVLTSLHDLTSTVLLEALSMGLPVVCLDHCGFSDVVDETCGIKIPVSTPGNVIRGFRRALFRLAADPGLRARLSEGARERARRYLWAGKTEQLAEITRGIGRKVFVTCYAISPYRGSEPGAGWHWLKAFAQSREIWCAYESIEFTDDIQRYRREHPGELDNIHFIPIPDKMSKRARRIWPPAFYHFYRQWHKRAYREAVGIHREVGLDAVYQMNMVTFREPGYLWKIPVPFVWGPVGAFGYTDWRLLPLMGVSGACEYAVRNVLNWKDAHFLARPRAAARKAARTGTLIAATSENHRFMKMLWGVDSHILCEVGTNAEDLANSISSRALDGVNP